MSSNSLILKNTFFLITRTLIISVISLFTVRELLRVLGAEGYGLFNLVFGIAILFTFINQAMVVSSQRYLAFYLGKKDEFLLTQAWNSSIFLHLIVAIIICIVLLIAKDSLIYRLLTIDENLLTSATFIYYAAIVSIFVTVIQSPFNALVLANENMSFYAWVSLAKSILNLLIIYLLTLPFSNKLETYTILYVLTSFLILSIYITFCYKKYKLLLSKKFLQNKLTKEMLFYSSWNIFGDFANVAKTQGINMVLNLFFGLIVNAAYAITTNVISVMSGLLGSILTSIRPQIYKSYAENDIERHFELLSYGSKYSYLFSLFLISPFLISINFIINLWLTNPPSFTIDFLKLALLILIIESLSGPLMAGIQATGKVKAYQIIVGFVVFLNLPLSYLLLKIYQNPVLPFFVAIMLSFISLFLRLMFLSKLTGYKLSSFLEKVIKPVMLVTVIVLPVYLLISRYINFYNPFIDFIIKCLFISIVNILVIFLVGLEHKERTKILNKFIRNNQ